MPRLTDHADLKKLCQRIHWDPRVDNSPPPREKGSQAALATPAGRELQALVLGAVLDSGVGNGSPKALCCKLTLHYLGFGDAAAAPKGMSAADAEFVDRRALEAADRVDPGRRIRVLLGEKGPHIR